MKLEFLLMCYYLRDDCESHSFSAASGTAWKIRGNRARGARYIAEEVWLNAKKGQGAQPDKDDVTADHIVNSDVQRRMTAIFANNAKASLASFYIN